MKREREDPCLICDHYHNYYAGEACGVCGHRLFLTAADAAPLTPVNVSAYPSEILCHFLYLGSYDNASRSGILKSMGISRILTAAPSCHNLYKNTFSYHCLKDSSNFDEAVEHLEQCEREKTRVLVHCMSGRNRSPAIVMSYLMKSKGWRLAQSYQWVKERRQSVELSQAMYEQLEEYEKKIFGQMAQPQQVFCIGNPNSGVQPALQGISSASCIARSMEFSSGKFQFGAGHPLNH